MLRNIQGLMILIAALSAVPLMGRESVCLNTGFCLTADSHSQQGKVYVLRTGGGTMEFPAEQIAEIIPLADLPSANLLARPQAEAVESFDAMLVRAALQEGLEPEFVRSVARIESNLHQDAVSNKGAVGLMQIDARGQRGCFRRGCTQGRR